MKPATSDRAAPRRISQPGDAAERQAEHKARSALDPGAAAPPRAAAGAGGAAVAAGGPGLPELGAGEALPQATARHLGQRLGADLSAVRLHRDAAAATQAYGAEAFALGAHVAFAPGRYNPDSAPGRELLAHELAHVAVTGGRSGDILRHPVAPTKIERHERDVLLGGGVPPKPGLTLEAFEAYTRAQADWFTAPSLSAAERESLWTLLHRALHSAPVLAGVGDMQLADLAAASAADWTALDAFCRACHGGSHTVRIAQRAIYPTLARRIALGSTLLGLEALLPPEVLEVTVGETHLAAIESNGWLPLLVAYFAVFAPHLQGRHGDPNPEIQRMLDLVTSPMGVLPFLGLLGRVRNLHRFSVNMLQRLVINFGHTARDRPVHLVLHTGHDSDAFQASAPLFEDLVLNSPNLVLMLEGQPSLASITAAVPALAATYGQLDGGGTPRIAQVMIAGHGSARSVGMAGTGNPHVVDGAVHYNADDLNLDSNLGPTTALLDTLLAHMDPAQARLVYAGCLVGSNPVPEGTAPAAMAGHIASTPSLGTFTEQRATAAGMAPGTVSAARASVGLSAASSLMDGSGNLALQYAFDQAAFGSAIAYVPVGMEPEGVLTAAVEVAASQGVVVAEALLRARLIYAAGSGWWDECTRMMVELALDGVAPSAGIDVTHVNALAHTAQIPFLGYFRVLTATHYTYFVNSRAFAAALYTKMMATPSFTAPADLSVQKARFVAEQGWLALDATRAANLMTYLDATPALNLDELVPHLSPADLALRSPDLFPPGAAVTGGRVRLALAWLQLDPANADVRAFLDGQVLTPAGGPTLTPAVQAQLAGTPERDVLEALGRLAAVVPGVGGAPALPAANADLVRTPAMRNDIRIEPRVYNASVLPAVLNVRDKPGMHGRPFAWLHRGDVVHVMGFTHDWAAIDQGGKLGFVYKTQVTAP